MASWRWFIGAAVSVCALAAPAQAQEDTPLIVAPPAVERSAPDDSPVSRGDEAPPDDDARPPDEVNEESEPPAMRLRVEWGGGAARRWSGTISVTEGAIARPVALGIEADEPGSMWLEADRLLISAPSPRPYDGVDIDVVAPLGAVLRIELVPGEESDAAEAVELPLSSLIGRRQNATLDDRKNRLHVSRVPGDQLRVEGIKDPLIFAPGETLEFELRPFLLASAADSTLWLRGRLVDAVKQKELAVFQEACQTDAEGTSPPVKFSLPLPDEEGVYDMVLEAGSRGVPNRLDLKHLVAERRVQLVVLTGDPRLPDNTNEPPDHLLLEIDPTKPGWWERLLPKVSMIPGLRKGPLGNGAAVPWRHPLGEMLSLEPASAETGVGWQAYPLPLHAPGEPHILEIEYPGDVPQNLGVSIVEPSAPGVVKSFNLDSGIYLPDEAAEAEPRLAKHRLVFWPRTKTPLVLLSNRSEAGRAVYGKIRMFGPSSAGTLAVRALSRDDWHLHSMLPRRFSQADQRSGRLLAAYYDRPLFAENFAAHEAVDAGLGRRLTDWRTFYEGGTRLVEYLNFAGNNALMITVLADGSTIYPSELLEPTPRHDTGVFFSTGQDVSRKDALELLFRLFDREGLRLIPSLDFSTPLPVLETLRREEEGDSIALIGADGRSWLETNGARRQLAPYYNPLDERVQRAMLDVVRELIARYQHHPSFAGVGLRLSADGYAQLPGASWGYDERTLTRFARDTKLRMPAGREGHAERVAMVEGPRRQAWLAWRAASLHGFYRQARAEVAAKHPDLKLYLADSAVFDRPELARDLRPALERKTTKTEEVMLATGINPALYQAADGIVLPRPQRLAPLNSLAAQAVNLEVNLDSRVDQLFSEHGASAALFYHEPREMRLASFEAKSPFKSGPTWLLAQSPPSGNYNRHRFVHTIATLDARAIFDGGAMLSLGQETELEPVIAAFRQLPDLPFETLAGPTQPVTVRWLSHAGRTFVYFANDSPWQVEINVTVDLPAECSVRGFYSGRRLPGLAGDGLKRSWTLSLEPYDLQGAVFSAAGVKFSKPRVAVDSKLVAQLERRIQDLSGRIVVLQNPSPLKSPNNGGFEVAGRGTIPGWDTGRPANPLLNPFMRAAPAGRVTLDAGAHHGGRQAAHLTGSAAPATLTSQPFAAPKTGWLSVSLWLRAADNRAKLRVGIALDGRHAGEPYHRQGEIAGASIPAGQWKRFDIEFPELPPEELSPLQLRVACTGGDVWVDDVELFDLEKLDAGRRLTLVWLTIERAGAKFDEQEYADCLRLLDGYWSRYLARNVPAARQPVATHPRRRPPAPPPVKTGLLDRVRDSVRGLVR
jgi:hypothetical protein